MIIPICLDLFLNQVPIVKFGISIQDMYVSLMTMIVTVVTMR